MRGGKEGLRKLEWGRKEMSRFENGRVNSERGMVLREGMGGGGKKNGGECYKTCHSIC